MQGRFYECYLHTHLQPNNPPQAHFPIGSSKMYPQSINPPPTLLLHLSILKTLLCHVLENLLCHHSVSTITHFCLQVFPQKAFRQLRNFQRKILIYKCFENNLALKHLPQ